MSTHALSNIPESNLIPVFLGKIGDIPAHVCDARVLHAFLEVGRDFSNWIKERIEEYGFIENQDFVIDSPKRGNQKGRGGDRRSKDYHLSLDMAKELSMVERNDKGREARRYFIDCERRALAAAGQVALPAHTDALIPSEQQTLSEIVHRKAETAPPALIGKAKAEIWSRVHNKFRVSQYAQLPRTQLTDAILYVNQMELRTIKKAIPNPEPPRALPFSIHYPMETAAPPMGYTGLSHSAFAADTTWSDPGWGLLMKLRDAGLNVDGPIYSHYAKVHIIRVMHDALTGKMKEVFNGMCASLPYAPIYLR